MITRIRIEGTLPKINTKWTPILRKAAALMEMSVRLNFMTGGRPDRWVPLQKPKGMPSFLRKSGLLQSTLRSRVEEKAAIVEVGPKSKVPYIFIHQRGGWAGRGRRSYIPPRPYMVLQAADLEQIKLLFADNLVERGGQKINVTID